ncbi:hypothetical protein [Bacillus sp. FJAT-45350]|uniref:hypothetical protein n=1 Tax=Bacillus sp. FJAT-45350 TaxID=2011014 RepID=UPI000BB8193A|nr:hypothetical protein [Bacillus sp. FJAT-45350]
MHKYQAMESFVDQVEATKNGKLELTKAIWEDFKNNLKHYHEEEVADVLMQIELRTKVNPAFIAFHFDNQELLTRDDIESFI